MVQDPGVSTEGTRSYDALRAGEFGYVTEEVTIESGQNLTRGTCLGQVTSSGEWKIVDDAQADGSEVLRGVLAEDADASGGAIQAVIYRNGVFAEEKVTLGGDDTVADHRQAAADKGIFFKSIYEK